MNEKGKSCKFSETKVMKNSLKLCVKDSLRKGK